MSSLKHKTVSGVLWTGLSKLIMQVVLLAVTAILARLLTKEDFGVVGMAAVITVAIGMVNDKGLGMAIVQRKDIEAPQLSTMFWGSVAFGLLLYVVSFAGSFPLALFFRNPQVQPVVAVIAIGFIIGGFGIVQKSMLTRDMAFKKLALVEMTAVLLSGGVAIVMAFMGFGVWSLVANVIGRDFIMVGLLWIVCAWRPRFHFSLAEFRQFLGFSAQVLANIGAVYLITNTDVTIIGRLLGSAALGVYSLALYVVKLPITRLSGIVAKVVFPAFSSVQDDLPSFKNAYLKAIKYISLLTFPMLVGLALFAHEFIAIFLGDKWIEMAPVLVILTPMAMLKSVGTIKGSVLMAVGRPDIELKWNLIYFAPLVALLYWGTRYGLVGVAASFTILYVVTFPIIQQITNRQVNVSMREFFGAMVESAAATLVMAVVGLALRYYLAKVMACSDIIIFIAGVLLCVIAYFVTICIIDKSIVTEFKSMLINKHGSTRTETFKPVTNS